MAGNSLSVSGALFQGNTATDDGGAIYAGQDLELERSRCIDNEADRGGAVFQGGGGGSMQDGDILGLNWFVEGVQGKL